MKYDFDTIIDRKDTNSLKWDVLQDDLSMSIADMDFKTAPCVIEAIQRKANIGIYGYSRIPHAYYTSYQNWWNKRYGFKMDTNWMLFSSGVIPAISSIIRRLTHPNENILVLSPVYNIFYNCIRNNGRNVITSSLRYEDGAYSIDFKDLEQKLHNSQTTMMILCNPHNPIGKLWSEEELTRIANLCFQYHVLILCDEIHGDITEPGKKYIPFASINETCKQQSITCLSASKAFNLAGLQSACIVIPNETLRYRVRRGLDNDEVAEPNVFACEATIAAFNEGAPWLESLCRYISANKKTALQYITTNLTMLHMVKSDATYLIWIDCRVLHPFIDQFCEFLHHEKHLVVSSGSNYGESGNDFIRMNIACPKEVLLTGLQRFKEGVEQFIQLFLQDC